MGGFKKLLLSAAAIVSVYTCVGFAVAPTAPDFLIVHNDINRQSQAELNGNWFVTIPPNQDARFPWQLVQGDCQLTAGPVCSPEIYVILYNRALDVGTVHINLGSGELTVDNKSSVYQLEVVGKGEVSLVRKYSIVVKGEN